MSGADARSERLGQRKNIAGDKQIGIHSPTGEKVGRVSHLRNREFLFVVGGVAALHLDGIQGNRHVHFAAGNFH